MDPTSVPTHSAEIGTSFSTTDSTLTTGAGGVPAARDESPQPAATAAIAPVSKAASSEWTVTELRIGIIVVAPASCEIEEEEVRIGPRVHAKLCLVAHCGTVSRRQAKAIDVQVPADDLDPGVPTGTELVRDTRVGVET